MTHEKELVISLKDFALYIIRKWRALFIVTFACALVIGGFYATKTNNLESKNPYSKERRESILQALTEAETNEVENLFNRYCAYKSSISYIESYLNNSILMKLNPEKLPTLIVQYNVTSDEHNIISSFTSQSLGETEYQQIAALLGEDADPTRVFELISVYSTATDTDGFSVDINENSNTYVGNLNNIYKWVLSITVYANNKAQCENIMEIAEKAVQAQYKVLIDAGLQVTLARIGDNYTENASNWLADHHLSMISRSSSLKTEYDEYEKTELTNLSSNQKNYFAFLKDQYSNKENVTNKSRFFAIGGVLGAFLSLVTIFLEYFLGVRIRNKEDYLFRVESDDVIGVVYSLVKHKGLINKFINTIANRIFIDVDKTYDMSERAILLAKRIHLLCSNNGISDLYIVNDSSKQSAASFLSLIVSSISKEGIKVNYGKPLMNTEDFDTFIESKAVVYFGNFYDSKIETLFDYSKLFKENNTKKLGSILHGEA